MSVHTHTPTLVVADPRGLAVRHIDFHRLSAGNTPGRQVMCLGFDASGREVAVADPRLHALDRLTARCVPALSVRPLLNESADAGWRVSLFAVDGCLHEQWDSRGSHELTLYDDQRRPIAVWARLAEKRASAVERLTYAGLETDQNRRGQLVRHDDPAGSHEIRARAINGRAIAETRRFARLGQPVDWPESRGAREAVLEPGAGYTRRRCFDASNALIDMTDASGHRHLTRFDVAGQLCDRVLQLSHRPDAWTLAAAIEYDAHGRFVQETMGHGLTTRCEYDDADGHLVKLWVTRKDSKRLQDLRYTYDPVGNIVAVTDATQPAVFHGNQRVDAVSRYRYDSLYRLIEASGKEVRPAAAHPGLPEQVADPGRLRHYTQRFDYDEAGNLLARHHSGAPTWRMAVSERSNRSLPQRPDGSPPEPPAIDAGFDANGNQRELLPGQRLHWDTRNQLQRVVLVGRQSGPDDAESYHYDAGGKRLRKVRLTYSGDRCRVRETRYLPGLELHSDDATGERWQTLVVETGHGVVRVLHWTVGIPEGMANDHVRYDLTDHLGSSVLELDGTGALLAREGYYPFGGTAWWTARSALDARYRSTRYSGRERDATGLYYYGLRYYAPWLQRWISPDPSGTQDGLNLYSMVGANPVSFVDLQGLGRHAVDRWRDAYDRVLAQRQAIRVRSRGKGVVSVSISGDNGVFAQVGIPLERPTQAPRNLSYLAVDSRFKGQIAGGTQAVHLNDGSDLRKVTARSSGDLAFINGGFFNLDQRASRMHPVHASIGNNRIGGTAKPNVALPLVYREDYKKVRMDDGSFVLSAPELSQGGQVRFDAGQLQKSRFQFSPEKNEPGWLAHADQPNSRSAISVAEPGGVTRLAVGISATRGAEAPGYDMVEWATVMARLDTLNGARSKGSINLDGGGSSSLGYIDKRGKRVFSRASGDENQYVGNFLAFSRNRGGVMGRFSRMFR